MSDFEKALEQWHKEQRIAEEEQKARMSLPYTPPEIEPAELTADEKKQVLNYTLCFSKGLLEDGVIECDDDNFRNKREACYILLEKSKELLAEAIEKGQI